MVKLFKQDDKDYFKNGVQDINNNEGLVVSNSLLKKIIKRGLHDVLVLDKKDEISDSLQKSFDIGSATHCKILEPYEFDKRFYVADKSDPFHKGIRLNKKDFEFIGEVEDNMKIKYPELMDGENAELTVEWVMDGVKCKLKADKIVRHSHGIDIYDLKSTYQDFFKMKMSKDGNRWELRRLMQDLDYDLQAYFYTKGVEAWAREQGIMGEISFYFCFVSTSSKDVQVFKTGAELMESGQDKFNLAWSDIVDFVNHGKEAVKKELLI